MTAGGWRPPAGAWEASNVGRFAAAHGIADLETLRARSVAEPEWFWAAVADHLGLPFTRRWDAVLDTSDGIEWARWFVGARLNLADACCDRWAAADPHGPALVWEGEAGDRRDVTWEGLQAMVDATARLLGDLGVRPGDAVGILLPMLPQTVAALLAAAKLGAVFLPLFSGFGAEAVRARLADAGAVVLLTCTTSTRRGRPVPLAATALEAVEGTSVRHVACLARTGDALPADRRVVPWEPDGGPGGPPLTAVAVDSEHTLFVAYTSGTTGRPKGSVHVHGGFLVKIAEEVAFQFDCRRSDTLFWFTDMGWIMGQWEIVGTLATGATLALYEGAPDWPDPGRLWRYVESSGTTILGMSPTLVRALRAHGDAPVRAAGLDRLRILGSTGEPWNEDPWHWYADVVGGGRCPVVNISGGTEVGACFLSPHPVEPIAPMSLGGPALGMAVDVVDGDGRPVRGEVGELVCRQPWPGMTRGLFGDPERYLETYWRKIPGMWVHGDWASVVDGQWYLHGRSDDTITVAGKRLGPAEVESVLVGDPAVVEAAAVGVPDEVKGESLWCFVVLSPGSSLDGEVAERLRSLVAGALGTSFRPSRVVAVQALPKTRSQKVVRRAIRAVVTGDDPGDLSSLEDPGSIDAIKVAV